MLNSTEHSEMREGGELTAVNALPKISTLDISLGARQIGKFTTLEVAGEIDESRADLAGDCFHELWQSNPTQKAEIPPSRAVNRALLDWAKQSPAWTGTHAEAAGNLSVSIPSAEILFSSLSTEEALQEALKKQEEAAEQEKEADAQDALAEALNGIGDGAGAAQAMGQAAQARAMAKQAAQEGVQMIQAAQNDKQTQAAVNLSVRQAQNAAKEAAEAARGFGSEQGNPLRHDTRAAQEFAKRQTAKIRKIAKMAGRVRGLVSQSRRKRVAFGFVPTRVVNTKNLQNAFPSELSLLSKNAPPALRADAIARLAETGLLGWEMRGNADKRGVFVAATDVTGSMGVTRADGYTREESAKGLALGVAQEARADGRRYYLFSFADFNTPTVGVASSEDWAKHLDWAEQDFGGGTSFDRALIDSMSYLSAMGQDAKKADVLFISDGEGRVSDKVAKQWESFANETGARLMYIPVGDCSYGDIESLADMVYPVSDLTGEDVDGAADALTQKLF